MSLRQLAFQYDVLKGRLRTCTLQIEQAFGKIIGDHDSDAEVRTKLKDLQANPQYTDMFARIMHGSREDATQILAEIIHVCRKRYHHADIAAGAPIGKPALDAVELWSGVFRNLTRQVYIHPRMYNIKDSISLKESMVLIEEAVELSIFERVPIDFAAIPKHNVMPLRAENLQRRRHTGLNQRVVPSVIPDDGTTTVMSAYMGSTGGGSGGSRLSQLTNQLSRHHGDSPDAESVMRLRTQGVTRSRIGGTQISESEDLIRVDV